MQTFLPYGNFKESAECLDDIRLRKQIVEARQIIDALREGSAWSNHPAVKMWEGYIEALAHYLLCFVVEYQGRVGIMQSAGKYLAEINIALDILKNINGENEINMPYWLYDEAFHASHRSNLLRKDKEFYSKYLWIEPDNLDYVWPTYYENFNTPHIRRLTDDGLKSLLKARKRKEKNGE